ncbi:MAG TPA: 2-C-methyl-D-erythritol 4-phosphate cytidylyltransferase [Casimicrobiaceae bacterium]
MGIGRSTQSHTRTRIRIVVPAAGSGTRFAAGIPKQYADLGGKPMLTRTLERLATIGAEETLVALSPDDSQYDTMIGHRPGIVALRCGGATRGATVRNAVAMLASRCDGDDWILVHDAARPCVSYDALSRLVTDLADDAVGGLLAVPLADTLKRAEGAAELRVLRTEAREGLWLAQTPQMFRCRVLAAAYRGDAAADCTDEAQAVEELAAAGGCAKPRLVRGSSDNLKITRPADLALALAILKLQEAM